MLISCPHCTGSFSVTVKAVGAVQRSYPGSPLTSKVLRSVQSFMREQGPGDHSFRDLVRAYHASPTGPSESWPALNDNAFARALTRNGAVKWRTAKERFYSIPEIAADQKPPPVATSVQDRIDAEAYQEALVTHGRGENRVVTVEQSVPAYIHPGEETYTAAEVAAAIPKESAIDRISRMARERREKEAEERARELHELHDHPEADQ